MTSPDAGWHQRDLVPRPDPTLLTNVAIEQVTLQYRRELIQLRELLEVQVRSLSALLDERYATQTKALDAAFVAAEKAVATALSSAEKAVAKAEAANEARFEGVNEFRKALSDQTATFLPRPEYLTAHRALEDKVTALSDRASALELRFTSRLDLAGGAVAGETAQRAEDRAGRASTSQLVVPAIMVVATLIAVISLILTLTHKGG